MPLRRLTVALVTIAAAIGVSAAIAMPAGADIRASVAMPTGASLNAARYPVGNAATGYLALSLHPAAAPPGVNVWTCRPTAAHPRPVILLPGTLWALQDSFAALGPILANHGYCVFGLNYGASALTAQTGGRVYAAGDIPTSAGQLAQFVDQVLTATKARQVDVVGWSQGGMMPRYYLRFLGGAAKVANLIGLASSSHGTTLDGMFRLITETGALPERRRSA